MSAERLREAAKVLRERAEAATPGPWEATDSFGRDAGRAYVVPGDPEIPTYVSAGGSPDEDRDADYIAMMHPGVGLALADWLELVSAWIDEGLGLVPSDINIGDAWADVEGQARKVADLVLALLDDAPSEADDV